MRETAGAQITVDLGAVDKVLEMHASKIMLVFHQVRTSCCLLWFCQIAPLPHTLRHATLGVVVMKCLIRKKYNLNHPSSLVSIFLCCCACASFFPPTLDSLFLSYKSIYKRICRGGHLQVQKNIKLGWLNFKKRSTSPKELGMSKKCKLHYYKVKISSLFLYPLGVRSTTSSVLINILNTINIILAELAVCQGKTPTPFCRCKWL